MVGRKEAAFVLLLLLVQQLSAAARPSFWDGREWEDATVRRLQEQDHEPDWERKADGKGGWVDQLGGDGQSGGWKSVVTVGEWEGKEVR